MEKKFAGRNFREFREVAKLNSREIFLDTKFAKINSREIFHKNSKISNFVWKGECAGSNGIKYINDFQF